VKFFPFCIGAQGLMASANEALTYPIYGITHKKSETQKLIFFHCKLEVTPSLLRVWTVL